MGGTRIFALLVKVKSMGGMASSNRVCLWYLGT